MNKHVREMILEDAIHSAIEAERKAIIYKGTLIILVGVMLVRRVIKCLIA